MESIFARFATSQAKRCHQTKFKPKVAVCIVLCVLQVVFIQDLRQYEGANVNTTVASFVVAFIPQIQFIPIKSFSIPFIFSLLFLGCCLFVVKEQSYFLCVCV